MNAGTDWLALLLSTDAPALPAPWVMRLGLTVGWALVLALLVAGLSWRLPLKIRRWMALALALWTMVPGPVSPDYWLGLAFHAPSLTAMLLCGWCLQRVLFSSGDSALSSPRTARLGLSPGPSAYLAGLLWALVVLGYLLLVDTFAVLPLQMYAWGFSPMLLLVLLGLCLLPWLFGRYPLAGKAAPLWLVSGALLLFAVTRLPTGNLWDALMDPWLWLFLQYLLVRNLYLRLRKPTSPATIRG